MVFSEADGVPHDDQSDLSLSEGQQQRLCIVLLDEPTRRLTPISTANIGELINELKSDYTIAIVTHNMQQAARISDCTAFMYLGELIEFNETATLFMRPERKQTEDDITGQFG